jgi:hypothetical protein
MNTRLNFLTPPPLVAVFGFFFVKKNDHPSLVNVFILVTIILVSTAIFGKGTRVGSHFY